MLENDYIMRLIEQFTMVLEKILFKKERRQYQEARIDIDQAFTELLGLDREAVRLLSLGGLLTILTLNGQLDIERCRIAAALLREEGEVLELEQGKGAGFASFRKAICLYIELFRQQDDRYAEEAEQNIRLILPRLEQYELPDEVYKYLIEYYMLKESYSRAEAMLLRLLESNTPDSYDYGQRFYQELLSRSDEELQHGHLPREAIEEGLKELESRKRSVERESA